MCCRAVADSVIVRLPSLAFRDVFERSPDAMIRVVQLVMARVQRVIFVALHQYLGLTSELVRQVSGLPLEGIHSKSQIVLTFTFNIQGEDYAADYSGAVGSVSSEESLSEALDPATDGVSSPSPIRYPRCRQNTGTIFWTLSVANSYHSVSFNNILQPFFTDILFEFAPVGPPLLQTAAG